MFSATLITGLFVTTSPPVSAWETGWSYKQPIRINSSYVDSDIHGFPILLQFSSAGMVGKCQNDGDDLKFIDVNNVTQLPHEIECFSDDGNFVNATIWVNITNISSTSATWFHMYYGNAGASNQQQPYKTWNMTVYESIYHMTDNHTIYDSTRTGANSTSRNGSSSNVTGKIGGAVQGTATSGWGFGNVHNPRNVSDMGFSVWFTQSPNNRGDYILMCRAGSGKGYFVQGAILNAGGDGPYGCYGQFNSLGGSTQWAGQKFLDTYNVSNNHWQHLYYSNTSVDTYICINNTYDTATDKGAGTLGWTDTTGEEFFLGCYKDGDDPAIDREFQGKLDEVRVYKINPSSAWRSLEFNITNQTSGLITYGPEESNIEVTVENSNPVPTNGAIDQERNPTLEITVNCNKKKWMNQTFWSNSSGSWAPFQVNASVTNGTLKAYPSNFTGYSTTYYWSSNLSYNSTVWDNDTYYFTTRGPHSGWIDGWTIDMGHTCSPTGYLYGNWSFLEHVPEGAYNENWIRTNYSLWSIKDDSSWWMGNYTMEVNYTLTNNSFSLLNSSGCNRSQVFGWVHSNSSNTIYPYLIFEYKTASDFYCIMWSQLNLKAWVLHWNGTVMLDLFTNTEVDDPLTDATDIYNSNYFGGEGYYLNDFGNYYKYIYNDKNGSLRFKFWGPQFMSEPPGWVFEITHANITQASPHCQGVGVFNPNHVMGEMQYDLMSYWQLNYTTNSSAWINISDYNESRPHMEFPGINATNITAFLAYFNDTFSGNISTETVAMIMKDNITNPMNLESRMFTMAKPEADEQNDTVYYYSCMVYNFSEIDPETMYEDFLHLHVQHCPEYQIDMAEYGDLIVGIDVDNNRQWDANDRVYCAYLDDGGDVTKITYDGNGNAIPSIWGATLFQSMPSAVGNLHRYTSFINYVANIPLADLVKTDGHPINGTDVFGLSIVTTNSGSLGIPCIWQNWNETTDSPYHAESEFDDIDYFFTELGEGAKGANATTLKRWGEGVITNYGASKDDPSYNASVEGFIDNTSTEAGDTYKWANITFWCNNTGAGALSNVIVNMTWWNCSCADLDMDYLSSSFPHANISYYNDSCYIIIDMGEIAPSATHFHYLNINITNCTGVSSATERINMSVNATEMTEANPMSTPLRFNWGRYAVRVCVAYTTDVTDMTSIGNSVFTIVGVIMIIASILMILFVVRRYQE